ncbi:nonsense-mediated mRNA decay protein 3 [Methanococcus maripaludis]|uniref:Nonsense-mediated mRNA decay protein 3 n=1 Tax=Methanococcus maripaludis TaxID=39152 RepID=A0A7J9NKZ4_METMI|nr:60S ribosomal export protein NMD3 [Methanococcus maripaludis]MBA2846103.1 nonsense-mediated mRNA decay protein 3 [Methanococcus maripaludis]
MKGFCYRCGHEGELLDGLCKICYTHMNPLIEVDNEVHVEVCHMCGSYKRKLWQDPQKRETYEIMEEIAYFGVKDNLKKANKSIDVEIMPQEPKQLPGGKRSRVEIPTVVFAKGRLVGEDNDREEERHITVYLDMVQCPRCSRCMSNYYEGTLQVRAMNRFLNDKERIELDDFVRDEAGKRLNKDRMAFISKYIPQKEGLDYQMGSMGAIRNIASAIKAKYGGKSIETAKLVGVDKDTGKDMYRITVAVRIPEFKIGDILEHNEKIYVVSSLNESRVYMEPVELGDKIALVWNEIDKSAKLIKKGEDCETATVISITPDTITAMDDSNYEIYEYNNSIENVKEGNKIRIFKNEEINRILEIIE